jgi:hypothetical protein
VSTQCAFLFILLPFLGFFPAIVMRVAIFASVCSPTAMPSGTAKSVRRE